MEKMMKRSIVYSTAAAAAVCLVSVMPPAMAKKKTYNIAVVRWKPNDIYFNGVQYGQEIERKRLEKKHNVKINFNVFGADKVGPQRSFLDSQLTRGVDGVLLTPWRGAAMRASLAEMRRKDVPYVTTNAFVPKSKQTFVAFSSVKAGKLAGHAIVRRLNKLKGKNWPQKGGVIVELRCIVTASFDKERNKGYRDVLGPIVKKHKNLKIVSNADQCQGGKARKIVSNAISRYGKKNILAIASVEGTGAVGGAIPALKAAGLLYPYSNKNHIPITSIDGTVPELKAVAHGHLDHISVQPAIAEGIMSMKELWKEIQSGQVVLPGPKSRNNNVLKGNQLWRPVRVVSNPGFKGPWFQTHTYSVPGDVKPSNPRIWSNRVYKKEHGHMPNFSKK